MRTGTNRLYFKYTFNVLYPTLNVVYFSVNVRSEVVSIIPSHDKHVPAFSKDKQASPVGRVNKQAN